MNSDLPRIVRDDLQRAIRRLSHESMDATMQRVADSLHEINRALQEHIATLPCSLWQNDGYVYCSTHGEMAQASEPDDYCIRRRSGRHSSTRGEPQ